MNYHLLIKYTIAYIMSRIPFLVNLVNELAFDKGHSIGYSEGRKEGIRIGLEERKRILTEGFDLGMKKDIEERELDRINAREEGYLKGYNDGCKK